MVSLAQRTSPMGLDEVDLETRKRRARMREDPFTTYETHSDTLT